MTGKFPGKPCRQMTMLLRCVEFWVGQSIRVANLAFFKPACENLAFFDVFGLSSKTKKARQNLAFSSFFEVLALFKKSNKARWNPAFSGFFSEQCCTNLLVKAMSPANWLCDVKVALRNSGSFLFCSCWCQAKFLAFAKISDLLLFVSNFASKSKGIKFGVCFFDVCCVN